MIKTDIQVHNYTDSPMVTIRTGFGKIQEGTLKFIHPINLDDYDKFLQETKLYVDKDIPATNPLHSTMYYELQQTIDLLETLKSLKPKRQVRSINILGTIWKYIAGSPDHDDAEYIYKTLDEMSTNNNKQIIINKDFANQVNNITKIVNTFSNAIKKDSSIVREDIEIIRNKIRIIKESIINIKYAIQWAKNNIINSFLLNKAEMHLTISQLEKENMPFDNIEEALELANVNVLTNYSNILYVIKIPVTKFDIYENMIIRPVIKNNSVIHLNYKEILYHGDEMYSVKEKCKIHNNIKICKKEQLNNLSEDECIKHILQDKNSSCIKSNAEHVPNIEEISDGILFLNNINKTIISPTMNYHLEGTYLIRFSNATLKIDEETYFSLEAPEMIPLMNKMQGTPFEKSRLHILSLESLQELHLDNIKSIHFIKKVTWASNTAMVSISLATICLALCAICRSRKRKITTLVMKSSDFAQEKQTNTILPVRIHDLPYF